MNTRILKLPEVMEATALSRSSIYAYCSEGRFPQKISLGPRAVGWLESEVNAWLSEKAESRRKATQQESRS